ncbi:MAG TPA: RNA polymerase sigma factor [Cyclobacteriaceae bacterium]|nr:RNA polymerase sigma factor [Cyclobacteriaceae bacterium]
MAIVIDKNLSDGELVTRILSGEKHLFEWIMTKYNQRLYRIGVAILHDDAEVEEVMQSAYIKAYENMRQFEGKSSFATWLTRILINEALMTLKKRRAFESIDNIVGEPRIESQHPMKTILNDELSIMLKNAIAQLPTKYRIVFMMREIEGMSIAETTQCLLLSEANVKVRLNRAKEMLRNQLSHYVSPDLYDFHLDRCERIRKNVMAMIS